MNPWYLRCRIFGVPLSVYIAIPVICWGIGAWVGMILQKYFWWAITLPFKLLDRYFDWVRSVVNGWPVP